MAPIPDDPNWHELVARTRELVRAAGMEDFDESFDVPERFCVLDEDESAQSSRDLLQPDTFRSYVEEAVGFLSPVGPEAARQLFGALNAQLAGPVSRLELHQGEARWDLLASEPYAAVELARGALKSVLQTLKWEPFSGPSSTSGFRGPGRGPQ
jgi:hypothetical protein